MTAPAKDSNPAMVAARNSWRCVQAKDKQGWLDLMADSMVMEDPIGIAPTNPDGKGFLVEVDRVPGPSPVWLGAPVPPGTYTLSLFVGDELRVSRPLALGAQEQTERVVVH